MFERFTEKSIKVIMLAQREAKRLSHNFVNSEFILIGLIGEDTDIAAKVLKASGVSFEKVRVEVEKKCGRGDGYIAVEIPFTPTAKRVLEFAWDEARRLGHNFIGTEHLLLGVLRLPESGGMQVLHTLKVDTQHLRADIIRAVGEVNAAPIKIRPPEPIDLNEVDSAVHSVMVEAVISALPPSIQPILLNLRKVVCDKDQARRSNMWSKIYDLRDKESELLKQLAQQRAMPAEGRKISAELRQVRREKELAIKTQEFERAAVLRDQEAELSSRLLEIEAQAPEEDQKY